MSSSFEPTFPGANAPPAETKQILLTPMVRIKRNEYRPEKDGTVRISWDIEVSAPYGTDQAEIVERITQTRIHAEAMNMVLQRATQALARNFEGSPAFVAAMSKMNQWLNDQLRRPSP